MPLHEKTTIVLKSDNDEGNWTLKIRGSGPDDVIIIMHWGGEEANENMSQFTVKRSALTKAIRRVQ